jgi:hypothetical protein
MTGTGLRRRVEAPCPGSKYNIVTLAQGSDCLEFLKKKLENVGTCKSYVLFFDRSGTFISGYTLEPGESLHDQLTPPSNTYFIKYGCATDCGGTAILEFDVPYA